MKGLILHDREARQLSTTGKVLVVRVVKPQPVINLDGAFRWKGELYGDIEFEDQCTFAPIGTRFRIRQVKGLCIAETVAVAVKRVQEITEKECAATGVPRDAEPCDHTRQFCADIGCYGPTFKSTFITEWDRHNPKHPWAENSWAWFATMKRA